MSSKALTAIARGYMRVCVCVLKCTRHCSRFAHGCWLRPHQGQGQGEGGEQRVEERGASIWSQFGASCQVPLSAMQDASSQAQHSHASLGGLVRRKSTAGVLTHPPLLLADLSLFFPFSRCHSQNSCKIPGTAFEILPSLPECDFRETRTGCTTLM